MDSLRQVLVQILLRTFFLRRFLFLVQNFFIHLKVELLDFGQCRPLFQVLADRRHIVIAFLDLSLHFSHVLQTFLDLVPQLSGVMDGMVLRIRFCARLINAMSPDDHGHLSGNAILTTAQSISAQVYNVLLLDEQVWVYHTIPYHAILYLCGY